MLQRNQSRAELNRVIGHWLERQCADLRELDMLGEHSDIHDHMAQRARRLREEARIYESRR